MTKTGALARGQDGLGIFPLKEAAAQHQISLVLGDPAARSGGRLP